MRRILLALTLVAMCSGLTGCYKDMIIVDRNFDPSRSTPDRADFETTRIDILGLFNVSGDPVELRQVCKGHGAGIVQVKTLFNAFIIGVHKSYVYCTTRRAEAPTSPLKAKPNKDALATK